MSRSSDSDEGHVRKSRKYKVRDRDRSRDRKRHHRSDSRYSSNSKRYSTKSSRVSRSRSRSSSWHKLSRQRHRHRSRSKSKSSEYRKHQRPKHRHHSTSSSDSSTSGGSSVLSVSERSEQSSVEHSSSHKNKQKSRKPTETRNDVILLDSPPKPIIQPTFDSVDNLERIGNFDEINEINDDGFIPKSFTSARKIPDKVVIDLTSQTISVPQVKTTEEEDTVCHPSFYGDDTARMERWVKKLATYRQKLNIQ